MDIGSGQCISNLKTQNIKFRNDFCFKPFPTKNEYRSELRFYNIIILYLIITFHTEFIIILWYYFIHGAQKRLIIL